MGNGCETRPKRLPKVRPAAFLVMSAPPIMVSAHLCRPSLGTHKMGENVSHRLLRIVFWSSLMLTLASLFALAVIDEHLKNTASPLGIVSFELCAFQFNCAAIPASWSSEAKVYAAMSLGLDYLFMLAYPTAISCGLWLLAKINPSKLQRPMILMAYMIWLAGLADAIENYYLFQMLLGQSIVSHQWPATLSATAKFVCLVPALVLWLFGMTQSALSSRKGAAAST